MPVTLRYSRLDEIARRLQPETRRGVKEGAEVVAEAAKANVPVRTGRLKRAIHVERDLRSGPGLGLSAYAVVAGDRDAFYGHLVEHGSAVGGKGRPPIGPRPFLVPALEANREVVIGLVRRSIRDAVD